MIGFNVRISDVIGDLSIYTNATTIHVSEDEIVVEYEDRRVTHQTESTTEIVIRPNC